MKSAEQWVDGTRWIMPRGEIVKLVQAIQEDAWRDGMKCGMDLGIIPRFHWPADVFQLEFDKRFGVKKEP